MKNIYKLTLKLLLFLGCIIGTLASNAQTADFTSDVVSGCNPLIVSFTDKTVGTVSSYLWEFGDGKTATIKNPSTTYITPGTYTVKLTVKGVTTSTKTATIIVYNSPTVSYTAAPLGMCPCGLVSFTNTSKPNTTGAYTSLWSFGTGDLATTNDADYTFCDPGKYTISLKVTNSAGCASSLNDIDKIEVYNKPTAAFTSSKTTLCKIPDNVTFNATPSGGKAPYTYQWAFGDGGTATSASFTHSYTAVGSYDVRLIVTDANGCKDTITKTKHITAGAPKSDFKFPSTPACLGVALRFENTSTAKPISTTWKWSDGTPNMSGDIVTKVFFGAGITSITMVDEFGPGCKDSVTKTVAINPKPQPHFKIDPLYPCPAPAEIKFTNLTTTPADSFIWHFGDGSTSKEKNPTHTYTFDSVFFVYLIAKNSFGCIDTFRVRDTTKKFPLGYPSPYYDSANSPVAIKVFDTTPYFNDPKAGFTQKIAEGCLPFEVVCKYDLYSHIFYPAAAVPSGCGWVFGHTSPPWRYCDEVAVAADPYADEHVDHPIRYVPPSTSIHFYPQPFVSTHWDFGDGTTSTDEIGRHTYTVEGEYKITVTKLTANNCTRVDTYYIKAGPHTFPNFSMSPDTICKKDSVIFTNLSTGGAKKYFWDFSDETYFETDDTGSVAHKFNVSGRRRILLVADRNGCRDTVTKYLMINPPYGKIGLKYSCDTPFKVQFYDSSIQASSVIWDFGDGSPFSTIKNPVHIYGAAGEYTVRQFLYNDTTNCRDTIDRIINIFKPTAKFTMSKFAACIGDTIFLTPDMPSDNVERYDWAADITRHTDGVRFYIVPKERGIYDIWLKITDVHYCETSSTAKIYITKPDVKLTPTPATSCVPAVITLNDESSNLGGFENSAYTFKWSDGTVTTTDKKSSTRTLSTEGTYRIRYVVADENGCKDSFDYTIEARKIYANFMTNIDTFGCMYKDIKFTSLTEGAGLSHFWDFGDGTTGSGKEISHQYKNTGTYNVKLVVIDNIGCKDSIIKSGFIKIVKPKAEFTVDDSFSLCPPLLSNFTNSSSNGASTFFWDFKNKATSTRRNPSAIFVDPGKYNVMLVARDRYGCTDTAYKEVSIFGYDGAFSYTPIKGCAPLEVEFEVNGINADLMVWDFADGNTLKAISGVKQVHKYETPGKFLPRLILGDGLGCSTGSNGEDTIIVDDIEALVIHSPACINQPITFSNGSKSLFSSVSSSTWTFEDGTSSTSNTVTKTFTETGNQSITLKATNANGCTDIIEYTFYVDDLPTIKAIDTTICYGDEANLYATGGSSYKWAPSPTLSCTDCNSPITNAKFPAKYVVTGFDDNGCPNTDTLHLGIKTHADITVEPGVEVCENTPVQLRAYGVEKYTWTPETFLDNPNIPNPIATMSHSVTYKVIGYEGSCIPDTGIVNMIVHPLPRVDAGEDQNVLAGTEVRLNGSGNDVKEYTWTPDTYLDCSNCPTPTSRPTKSITYTLKGTTAFGCSDSDQVKIIIFCQNSQLFIPNTFTPNGDQQNDYFFPQGQGIDNVISFVVFNRWGQKVFEKKNMPINIKEEGWDGTLNGTPLGPDTYVYILEAKCDNGENVFWKGDVTLVK